MRRLLALALLLAAPWFAAVLGDAIKRDDGFVVGLLAGIVGATAIDLVMATSNDDAASTRMISFGANF